MAYKTCSAFEKASAADANFRCKYHYRPSDKRCGNCMFHAVESGYSYRCNNPNAFPPDVPEPLRILPINEDYVCDLWKRG